MKWLVPFLLLLGSYQLAGQTTDSALQLEKRLAEYLTLFIAANESAISEILALNKKWSKLEPDTRVYEDLTGAILHSILKGHPYAKIKKHALKEYPESILAQAFSNIDYKTIRDHYEVMIVMNEFQINADKSFKIDNKILEAFRYFDIQKGETIADIGAGKGLVSFLIGLLNENNHLYITELSDSLISFLKNRFNSLADEFRPYSHEIIKGGKKSTELPSKGCDKIIIRNTYHHFSNKKKMLKSIRKSLKDEGILILVEVFKEDALDKHHCKKIISEFEARAELSKSGLTLIDIYKNKHTTYLKYKKS